MDAEADTNVDLEKKRRRSSDETTDRAVRLKLGMFPAHQLTYNLSPEGFDVHQTVKTESRRTNKLRKHIALDFWNGVVDTHID